MAASCHSSSPGTCRDGNMEKSDRCHGHELSTDLSSKQACLVSQQVASGEL